MEEKHKYFKFKKEYDDISKLKLFIALSNYGLYKTENTNLKGIELALFESLKMAVDLEEEVIGLYGE